MTYQPFSLYGKTVLITGASSGIGKSIAVFCSKNGAKVFITARNEERLQQTLSDMPGDEKWSIASDLTDYHSIDLLVGQLPKLDGVVHCAGIGTNVLAKNIHQEDITRVMKTNFDAPVLLQSSLLRTKKINNSGSIVFIASMAAGSPTLGNSLYSASKGAIISYAKCLGLELAHKRIRVNCISPAMVWTDFIRFGGIDDEMLKVDEARYPLGRYGQPDDIAGLAVYLLSDESKWMTGSNIEITGGVKCL